MTDGITRHILLQDLRALLIGTVLAVTLVVCAAAVTVTWDRWLLSVLAIVVLNLVIATHHRPGRHVAQ